MGRRRRGRRRHPLPARVERDREESGTGVEYWTGSADIECSSSSGHIVSAQSGGGLRYPELMPIMEHHVVNVLKERNTSLLFSVSVLTNTFKSLRIITVQTTS